jgi:hypothetical protein
LQEQPFSILFTSLIFSLRVSREAEENGGAMPIHEAPPLGSLEEGAVSPAVRSVTIIQEVVQEETEKGKSSPRELTSALEEEIRREAPAVQILVRQYIVGLLKLTKYGASVAELPQGVGGLYDGRVRIAEATIQPDEQAPDVTTLLARIEETNEHEGYHARFHHEQPLIVPPAAQERGFAATIGGERFIGEEEIKEALTVTDTGDRFVSAEYRLRMQKLLRAVEISPTLTLEDIRKAVNGDHDLTAIDETPQAAGADAGAIAGTVGGDGEGTGGASEVRKAA